MQSRREFLRHAALLSTSAGMASAFPASILRALAIEPDKDSTFLDARHVVILMQENRSFDHAFGSLRGVRGFNDPRAITLPDGAPVFAQADAAGQRFVPFWLNIKQTKATWMGSLPHGWADQVDAYNHGLHNRWLHVKQSGEKEYSGIPLTLGYYRREDIPFYYALADAFTICDQHFCSSLTGTTPNRLHLWTGTLREKPSTDAPALVRNEDCDFGAWVTWTTFPERLEDAGVSWKIYQNELTCPSGLSDEQDAWLANFGDNPIEWFTQYGVRFAARHRAFVESQVKLLPGLIEEARTALAAATEPAQQKKLGKRLAALIAELEQHRAELPLFSPAQFEALSPRDKSLHARAFCTNAADPDFRSLADITYHDGQTERVLQVPKGDVLHQFRKDVAGGTLPTVSWIVAPERFSDHPTSPWYGAWYLSEVLDILTHNPEVWKKTIFILTYDENDGYFDHVPPFVAPHPARPETGRASAAIDTTLEHVELEHDREHVPSGPVRGSPIGLGYRVPMVIASPWSRGGCVCSQVFDHTSVLQFLEKFLSAKAGRKIQEPNINSWRRAVCGDLTSAFGPPGDTEPALPFESRDELIEAIHKARYTRLPTDFHALGPDELAALRTDPRGSNILPRQEPGVRRSCALPYELAADGNLSADRARFSIRLEAGNRIFGARAAGSPFLIYAYTSEGPRCRNYAVLPGDRVEDSWSLDDFNGGRYHLRVHGPNGFYREFSGGAEDPSIDLEALTAVDAAPASPSGNLELHARPRGAAAGLTLQVQDLSYGSAPRLLKVDSQPVVMSIPTQRSFGWYDLGIRTADGFGRRYAGRVETGRWGFSDPAMVGVPV